MEKNSEKIIELIDKLKSIFLDRYQLYDHFYSGDKETLIEAYNTIVDEKYNLGNYYSHDRETIEKYNTQYDTEIDKCYTALLSFGKESMDNLQKVEEQLEKIRNYELNYMSISEKREYLIDKILKN